MPFYIDCLPATEWMVQREPDIYVKDVRKGRESVESIKSHPLEIGDRRPFDGDMKLYGKRPDKYMNTIYKSIQMLNDFRGDIEHTVCLFYFSNLYGSNVWESQLPFRLCVTSYKGKPIQGYTSVVPFPEFFKGRWVNRYVDLSLAETSKDMKRILHINRIMEE